MTDNRKEIEKQLEEWGLESHRIGMIAGMIDLLIPTQSVSEWDVKDELKYFIAYLKDTRIEQILSDYKYKDVAGELIDYVRQLKFDMKKTEQRVISEVIQHGKHLIQIGEDGKRRLYKITEVSETQPTKDSREEYIDLLTKELRWHQDADNKSMGVTDDQKKWFCEGVIQSIYFIMGNYSRKSFEQLKVALETK